jgi:DNA-binding winged helix-turn-helix (wHTH) protein
VFLAGKAAVRDDSSILGRSRDRWFLYRIKGGEPRAVPALTASDIPIKWSEDGGFIYTVAALDGPGRSATDVFRVELATGRRILWKTLSLADAVGVQISPETVVITPDARSWRLVRRRRVEVSGRVEFGDFVLDLDARELRRADNPVSLSPKAYQLLETLVVNRPKALSKIALQERLWPDTFVVEKNLVNLVAEIREALGDKSAHPRFVRTVHRFGYAFQEPSATRPDSAQLPEQTFRFRLVWEEGRVGLGDGDHVVGRDPDLQLFLDSPSVSRRHAVIRIAGEEATVEDLGSKNGTFVADRRLDSTTRLVDGDVIRVGSIPLTFRVLRAWGSTHTEPHSEG